MTIEKNANGANSLNIILKGRLDTLTSPELEKALQGETAEQISIDLTELEYISSAGLRVLLNLHKKLMNKGGLTICHPNEMVQEVFDLTGFSSLLNIQKA